MKADKALEDLQKAMQHIQLAIWEIQSAGNEINLDPRLIDEGAVIGNVREAFHILATFMPDSSGQSRKVE